MRVRLEFGDCGLLTREQRLSGLRRCWFLIKPEVATVADLASELSRRFQLRRRCPNGIFFSMDEFVVPSWESTSFFREKDIISVHKRTCKKKKMITGGETVEKEAVPCSNGVLAIESRERIELTSNEVVRAGNPCLQTELAEMGLKRKHTEVEKPESSRKKKKAKLTTTEKPPVIIGSSCKEACKEAQEDVNQQSILGASTQEQSSHEKTNLSDANEASPMAAVVTADNADVSNERSQAIPERGTPLEENSNENIGGLTSGAIAKKFPSRSARRKYNQRRLKKELKKQATENMQTEGTPNGTNEHTTENQVVPAQEPAVTHKSVVARADRPGHIRFESEDEDDGNDNDGLTNVQPNEPPMECFQWNGIMNKTKGQKWGQDVKYKHNANRYDTVSDQRHATNEKFTEKSTSDIEKATPSQVNFESLTPLTGPPKESDLIAYRVVELSSTWCPDLSPFRVGEVKCYDPFSHRILLAPVPEYPILSDRGDDVDDGEEDAPYQDDLSLYKEDGSLEIEFTSLVDVRLLRGNGSGSPSASSDSRNQNSSQVATKKDISIDNRFTMTASGSSVDVVNPVSKEGAKDVNLINDPTGIEPNCTWEANCESAKKPQAQQNGSDMAAEKCSADYLVKPSSTEGHQHVERNIYNNWEIAVQNDTEDAIPDRPSGPSSIWEANGEVSNAGNTQAEQNGWDNWAPNTSIPSWSYRALRGSALGPTIAWLRGNNGNATDGYGRGRGRDGGRHRGRGRGHRRGRGN